MSLPGYQLHQGQVTIEQATTTVTVQLTKLVTVLFTVNEGATALSNALVTVSPKGAKSSRYQMQQHTNANGQAELKLPANAEFSYTVLLPSYTTVLSSFTLGEQDLSIEIPLQRKRNNVTFTVTDGYALLSGVTVDVEGTTAQTDTAGVAKFALLPGDHTYQIAHAPYAPVAGSITATEGFNEEVVLLQNYTITFVLKGDDGTPLAQAKLTVAGTEYSANPQGRIHGAMPAALRYRRRGNGNPYRCQGGGGAEELACLPCSIHCDLGANENSTRYNHRRRESGKNRRQRAGRTAPPQRKLQLHREQEWV